MESYTLYSVILLIIPCYYVLISKPLRLTLKYKQIFLQIFKWKWFPYTSLDKFSFSVYKKCQKMIPKYAKVWYDSWKLTPKAHFLNFSLSFAYFACT